MPRDLMPSKERDLDERFRKLSLSLCVPHRWLGEEKLGWYKKTKHPRVFCYLIILDYSIRKGIYPISSGLKLRVTANVALVRSYLYSRPWDWVIVYQAFTLRTYKFSDKNGSSGEEAYYDKGVSTFFFALEGKYLWLAGRDSSTEGTTQQCMPYR